MLILKTPKFDANSQRWIEPMEGLKLKVGFISNPAFRSRNAMVRRHTDKLNARFKVGTTEFNPAYEAGISKAFKRIKSEPN